VLIRTEEESRKLAIFQKYVATCRSLCTGKPICHPSWHVDSDGSDDAPFRTGDLLPDTMQWRLCRMRRECMKPRSAEDFLQEFHGLLAVNEVILPSARACFAKINLDERAGLDLGRLP